MNRLTVLQNEQTFFLPFEDGETVLRVLQKNGFSLHASCGGRGTCGHCLVLANGIKQKACQISASSHMEITLLSDFPDPQIETLFSSDTAKTTDSAGRYGIAVDIGTTTAALALVCLSDGSPCASSGFQNPGTIYGADVLSRMDASNRGLCMEIREGLCSCLHGEITALLRREGISPSQLDRICIAANTSMCHLLLGLSCKTLDKSPFLPFTLDYPILPAKDLFGEESSLSAAITILPGISAFLGGDIASGLFALDFPETDSCSLFVDLGTNGEMVLKNGPTLWGTSVAAGPAFEGSRIPGSDVLAAVFEMRKKNALDQTGLLQGIFFQTGYQYQEHSFTQEDIRSIQLAKASVRAGIETLLDAAGITADKVCQVFLCGGFGTHTDTDKAISIGMFPREFQGKICSMGNTSLRGAVRYLSSPSASYFEELRKKIALIELSSSEFYREQYVKWMDFL